MIAEAVKTTTNGNEQAGQETTMRMLEMISGFWVSRTIYIAAKLGLADLLKDGPKTAEELRRGYRDARAFALQSAARVSEHGGFD